MAEISSAVAQSGRSLRAAPRLREGDGKGLIPKYPSAAGLRWLLRFALAAPFVVLTLVLAAVPHYLDATANGALAAKADAIRSAPVGIGLLVTLYPPVPTILAALLPGGVIALGVFGSLAAGFFLQRVIEWLWRRRLSVTQRIAFVLMLAATPLFAFLVTTNLEITLGLVLFGLGMIDLVRFIVFANTQAGFRVGMYFAAAALSAPAFLFSIIIAACVAPFLVHSRRGAGFANLLVLVFPTVAAFVTVEVLEIVFRGDPLAVFGGSGLRFHPERITLVQSLLGSPWGWLYFVPAAAGMALAFLVRRPIVAFVPPLLMGSVLLMAVLGVTPQGSSGMTFLILMSVAIAFAPRARRLPARTMTIVLALTQIVVGWASAFLVYDTVAQWMSAVREGIPG